jgi:SOS-response transcriptional repressor LexA
MQNLQSLIQYQLSEGRTEQELAEDIGVSKFTIHGVLKGKAQKNPEILNKFARYFRKDVDLLHPGGTDLSPSQRTDKDPNGHPKSYRKVPVLSWKQIRQVLEHPDLIPFLVSREGRVETDLSGTHIFALQVEDDSMEPLFHPGEIFFVNMDLRPQDTHYVVVLNQTTKTAPACLRQLQMVGGKYVLHPLNNKYQEAPLTNKQKIVGRVVRLRMDL